MPIEYYICLALYSFIVLFIGWCIGYKDAKKKYKIYRLLYENELKENMIIKGLQGACNNDRN